MARQPGFLQFLVATNPANECEVTIMLMMDSRESLDAFMRGDHDLVQTATKMSDCYTDLAVEILDVVDPGPIEVRVDLAPNAAGTGAQIVALGQLYRWTAVLRAGLEVDVFAKIGREGCSLDALVAAYGVTADRIGRLLAGLATMNLVVREGDHVRLTAPAIRHLLPDSPAYLGDHVLHDSRPALWNRWHQLASGLGLPTPPQLETHARFLRAMSNVAAAGQAKAMLAAVDLSGRAHLLDVGGALGDYAIAACQAHPQLRATVCDQAASEAACRARIREAGLEGRIAFVVADYRVALPEGRFDLILLSNVLRGETEAEAEALLRRCHAACMSGGAILVHDAFPDARPGLGPSLPVLFGLHLPDAMNGSIARVTELLVACGFLAVEVHELDQWILCDRLVVAHRDPS